MAPDGELRDDSALLRARICAIENELHEIARGLAHQQSLATRDVELREELLRTRRELARQVLLR